MVMTPSYCGKFMNPTDQSAGTDIKRGLLKAKLGLGSVGMMFIGDSITNPYVSGRLAQSCIKRWPINTSGAMAGLLANGDSGWPISNFPPSDGPTVAQVLGPSGSGLRPGDAFLDGSTGHNLLRTVPYQFLAEYSNFGTTHQGLFYPNNAYNVDWDSGQNVRVRLVYRANTNAPTDHRLVGRTRSDSSQADVGNVQFNATTNPTVIQTQTLDFARSTGTLSNSNHQGRTWNTTETAGMRCDYLALSFELQTRPTRSIFWAYSGEGGYTTQSHLAAGESLNIGGFGAYTTYYSDAALDAHLLAYNINTFFIYLGQNQSANENPGGGTVGSYQTNVSNIISRYKASCARVGITNPTFILVSIYPTSDDTTRSINIANALRNIAALDPTVEMIDLRAYVTATFGAYTSWQATYSPDGIHPNAAFSNILADYIWSRL